MLNYPFKPENIEDLYKNIELTSQSGYYPVGKNNKWHSGIHFVTSNPIKVINNGTIIAYRISKDFKKKEKSSEISEYLYNNLTKNEQECYEVKENNIGKTIIKTYVLKGDVTEEQKYLLYSNSFVLIKNEINSADLEESIPIYSLYMNLLPDCKNPMSQKEEYGEISSNMVNNTPFYRNWVFKVKNNYTGNKLYHRLNISGVDSVYEGSTFVSKYCTELNRKKLSDFKDILCCRFNFTGSIVKLPLETVKVTSVTFTIKNKEARKIYKIDNSFTVGYCKETTKFTIVGDDCEKLFSTNKDNCFIEINIGSNDIEEFTPVNCWLRKYLVNKDCYAEVFKNPKIYSLQRSVTDAEKPIVLDESKLPVKLGFINYPTLVYASKYDAYKGRDIQCDKSMDAYIPVVTYLQETKKPKRLNLFNAELIITEIQGEIKYNSTNAKHFVNETGVMKYWLNKQSEDGEPVGLLKSSDEFRFESSENDIIQDKIISSAIIQLKDKKFKINVDELPSKMFLAKSVTEKNIFDSIQLCEIPVTEDDVIGLPGKDVLGRKSFFDFAVILEKSIFEYKSKSNEEKKYLIDIPENINFYKRSVKKLNENKQFFPSGTSYKVIQSDSFADEIVKKIQITKIPVWVRDSDIQINIKDNTCKIIKPLSGYWLINIYGNYTRTDKKTNPQTEWLTKELESLRNEFIVQGKDFTILQTNDRHEVQIEIDFTQYAKDLQFWVKNIAFFSQETGLTTESKNIIFYLENPICKTVQEVTAPSSFSNIKKIGDSVKFSDSLELCNLVGTDYYINKNTIDKCQHEAFDWNYYFTEITEDAREKGTKGTQGDIFCNRSEVIAQIDVDNEQNDIPGWQYRVKDNQITQAELNQVYTDNEISNKIRERLRKLVCKHPLEWNKKIYENIKDDYEKATGCQLQNEQELKDEADATDIWDGLKPLNDIADSNDCLWFVHPVYFFNHMDRVGAFGFNPYEKKIIKPRFSEDDDPEIVVSSNPGFAPAVKDNKNDKIRFPDSYKKKLNNMDLYWAAVNYDFGVTKGYGGKHTGIDLAGTEGTPIYALVEGTVIATTYQITVENTYKKGIHCYGRMMLILGCDNKLYLLSHLSSFKKNVGQKVYIGDVVAEVGNTGYSNGAHLHLEVFVFNSTKNIEDILFFSKNEDIDNHSNNCLHKNDGGTGVGEEADLRWSEKFNKTRENERRHPLKQ